MLMHVSRLARGAMVLAVLVSVAALSASGAGPGGEVSKVYLDHLSESVALSYFAAHPDQAPGALRSSLVALQNEPKGRTVQQCGANANKDVFNCDFSGLPQNEESTGVCATNDNFVLGGANDYEGLIVNGATTGWYWSTDGGHSVAKSGYLPPVTVGTPSREVPSGGDPVDFIPGGCDSLYAASLAYDPATAPFGPNGVALYKTTQANLAACAGFDDPTCWPVKRVIAESDGDVFNDKPWMFVGSQAGKRYVWATWTEFANDPSAPIGYNGAQIKAVRCDDDLVTCTPAIPISSPANDQDVQFSDVTIGPDGRAYITWAGIQGELPGANGQPGQPQTFVIKERTETAPGSAVFGPEHVVYTETMAIPFGGFLQANDFRVATYPKSDVVMVNGAPRIFVIWEACTARFLDTTCEEPQVKLSYSLDPDGNTWSAPIILSNGGVNYFVTISADRSNTTNNLAAAWYTNSFDTQFENAQDVVATSINPLTGQSRGLKRLTQSSNEPEADPLLGGLFIGDYIEGTLVRNRYDVHYNANYRKTQVLGIFGPPFSTAPPVNQQDNYLAVTALN